MTARSIFILFVLLRLTGQAAAQTAMVNPVARSKQSLNGTWQVIIDPNNTGEWLKVWQERKPEKKTDFFEYGFDNGPVLRVPGDFNSQRPELTYFEGTVWYKRTFNHTPTDKRLFLYFEGANYLADVYLNGVKLGSHEGGFTPFQFDITSQVKAGENALVVKTNNQRQLSGLPSYGFDWLNFGGITRNVWLIETPATYVDDYTVQLKKGSLKTITATVQLKGPQAAGSEVRLNIPELRIRKKLTADANGYAYMEFPAQVQPWSPAAPKLYQVVLETSAEAVTDTIGFRCIETKAGQVWLNTHPIFLKGVNIHEENPYTGARAATAADDSVLLRAAKDLGCNLVRLAHYPHNEQTIRLAERMGLLVWDELPIYQHINFSDAAVPVKMETMLKEMIRRDKNRCGVVIWSLSNETYPSTPGRNKALIELTAACRALDSTRLITHVTNTQQYAGNVVTVTDTLYHFADLICVNEYIGWYVPWQGNPADTKWRLAFGDKAVMISEFGGEALYGRRKEPEDMAASWSEAYQAEIYRKQLAMFENIPHLAGVCPWILFDYKSPGRMHPVYQKGYNRKGLLSEKGERKQAWQVMKNYYGKR